MMSSEEAQEFHAYSLVNKLLAKVNAQPSQHSLPLQDPNLFNEEITMGLRSLNNAQYKLQLQASESIGELAVSTTQILNSAQAMSTQMQEQKGDIGENDKAEESKEAQLSDVAMID